MTYVSAYSIDSLQYFWLTTVLTILDGISAVILCCYGKLFQFVILNL